MNEQELRTVVINVVTRYLQLEKSGNDLPVEVRERHVHLSQADVDALFGPGHTLTPKQCLSKPGHFLACEQVSVVTAKGELRSVAVYGPVRKRTQVELTWADTKALGLHAPVRRSGDLSGCPDVSLYVGTRGIQAEQSAMVPQNHIHLTPEDAARIGVSDGQRVKVEMKTARPIVFGDVEIRVCTGMFSAIHIDLDEADACAFRCGDVGRIVL